MANDKIYIVKMEVKASSLKEAMRTKGVIYSIEETTQPVEEQTQLIGFHRK